MKRRRWPFIVGAIVLCLILLFAVGAASAYQTESGDGRPFILISGLGAAVIAAVIVALVQRATRFGPADRDSNPDDLEFTVAPLDPFVTSVTAARWQFGDSSALPAFGSFSRPLVVTTDAGITISKARGDAQPLVVIPAKSVRSISVDERTIQVSRVGVTTTVFCIVIEILVVRTPVTVVLPAPTSVGETDRASREMVGAWAEEMRAATYPLDD